MKTNLPSASRVYPLWLASPAFIIYTVFMIFPILMSLVYSFTDWNIERLYTLEFRGFKNYVYLFQDPIFLRALGNSLLFSFSTTLLKIVVGLALAVLLVKKIPGNSLFRTLFYMPCVLSTTVIGVLYSGILSLDGLLNNSLRSLGLGFLVFDWFSKYWSAMLSVILIETWMWAGFTMFIFIAGLQAIPRDYFECAEIEGANGWVKFFKITLPLLIPSFTVNITLNITGGLRCFDLIYVLTNGGPGFDTQVMNTFTFRAFGMGLLGETSASSIILAMVVVSLAFVMNKYLKSKEVEL